MNIDSILESRIEKIASCICIYADAIVLYGSQSGRRSLESDIDLLILTEKNNNKEIYKKISDLQIEFSQIIHAIVVSNEDLEENPDMNDIFTNGKLVWEK